MAFGFLSQREVGGRHVTSYKLPLDAFRAFRDRGNKAESMRALVMQKAPFGSCDQTLPVDVTELYAKLVAHGDSYVSHTWC